MTILDTACVYIFYYSPDLDDFAHGIIVDERYQVERKVMFFFCVILKPIVVQLRRLNMLIVGIILKLCSYCYYFHFTFFFIFADSKIVKAKDQRGAIAVYFVIFV